MYVTNAYTFHIIPGNNRPAPFVIILLTIVSNVKVKWRYMRIRNLKVIGLKKNDRKNMIFFYVDECEAKAWVYPSLIFYHNFHEGLGVGRIALDFRYRI